jgi:cytoskeletal protein CcmA (bactofilin family)
MFGKSKTTTESGNSLSAADPAAAMPTFLVRPPPPPAISEPVVKPSIISDAVDFVGDFRTKGALHIDGRAEGTIEAESITVGPTGSVEGTVHCGRLHVKGRFHGKVTCNDLIITDEAQVSGSMSYKTIIIQRGARVTGDFIVLNPD